MLHVDDIRKTRVYREAKAAGRQEERERQYREKLIAIPEMAALNIAPTEIARVLRLYVEVVYGQIAKNGTAN